MLFQFEDRIMVRKVFGYMNCRYMIYAVWNHAIYGSTISISLANIAYSYRPTANSL